MLNDSRGFTADEFTEACRRQVEYPAHRKWFTENGSWSFLLHCCKSGLLTRDGDLFFPTPELYVALDVPPPSWLPLSPKAGRNDAHAREQGSPPPPRRALDRFRSDTS
jgi:hypothetical protein